MTGPEVVMVLASALLHASWSAAIKASRSPLAFNALQGAIALAVALAVFGLLIPPTRLPPAIWPYLAGTAVTHAFYTAAMSIAFERADLSLVYPIIRSTPAFLPLPALLLFGETLSMGGLLGIAVVVAGIWVMHLRTDRGLRAALAPGMGFAWLTLAATVAYSLLDKGAMTAFTRSGWHGALPPAVAYWLLLSAGSALLYVPFALGRLGIRAVRDTARLEGRSALLAALVGLAGYGLILRAYQTAPASYVVAIRQTSVFFALAIAWLFLGERPGRQRLVGAAATVAGVLLIALAG